MNNEFVVVAIVSTEFDPPTFTTGFESDRGEDAVRVVVATDVTVASSTTYARNPFVQGVVVERALPVPEGHVVRQSGPRQNFVEEATGKVDVAVVEVAMKYEPFIKSVFTSGSI